MYHSTAKLQYSEKEEKKETLSMMTAAESYLPNECWECVFKFLDDGDYNNGHLKPLSLVSKQFLSITNSLRSTLALTVYNPTIVLHRFSNVTSLNLEFYYGNIDIILCEISCFPLKLTSLKFSNRETIPERGLRAFSKNITTLTSLTCSKIYSLRSSDLFLISNCFPLLEELDLTKPGEFKDQFKFLNAIKFLSLTLSKLRKINLTGHDYINYESLLHLFKNCKLLEEAIIFNYNRITTAAIYNRITSAAILASSNTLMNFGVRPQLKSLSLGSCSWLTDEKIIMFASVFPNLQLLDLSDCNDISDEGICQVLRCCKIRHLNLKKCNLVKLHILNFEVPKLEVLNLSKTSVDDETLNAISKNCCGLLQLLLIKCNNVTKKGVKHVVENCTQLTEINLKKCLNMNGDVLA